MSNGYYEIDPGIDQTDAATDAYLLSEALKEDGDIWAGYFDAIWVGDSWTIHQLPPGITDLEIEQRRHRVFLLVCRFRPRNSAEAHARAKSIQKYSKTTDNWRKDKSHVLLAILKKKRGRIR